jgi:acetylglutamate kinase
VTPLFRDPERGVRVYKLGGPALRDAALLEGLAREIAAIPEAAAVVHGGGERVTRLLESLGIEAGFSEGRRATSDEAMPVVEMVLSGIVSKELAARLTASGVPALGLSGRDGGLVRARLEPGLGRVGVPEAVDPRPLAAAWSAGFLPLVSPVSQAPDGRAVNVNADEVALALARALGARGLVYLSDVNGVELEGAPVPELDASRAEQAIAAGEIGGGMALKVRTALEAVGAGIGEVVVAGAARLQGGFPGTRLIGGSA